MTESMTSKEFMKMIDRFLKHPVFVEQEALIVSAMYEGKITKKTAGELLLKVATHNLAKIRELWSMDATEIMRLAEEVEQSANQDVKEAGQ